MKSFLKKVFSGVALSAEEAEAVMDCMMNGQAKPEEIAGYLGALSARGETVDEIVGSVRSMRRHARPFPVKRQDLIDVCGTGGDGAQTFNVSTTNALLLAAAGLGVVKHGNRAISSACGSADVLEALGIPLERGSQAVASDVERLGFGFLFAPTFHPAMQHVGSTRRALGVRTMFNLLGPLANPAPVRRQIIGVFAPQWLYPMAEALHRLGAEEALVVWGEDGLDEISLSGPTRAVHLKNGVLQSLTLTPEDFGVARAPVASLRGGDAQTNAAIVEGILCGSDPGPRRDIVLINAGAALVIAGRAVSWQQGADMAKAVIEQGAAVRLLKKVRGVSESHGADQSSPPPTLVRIAAAVSQRLESRKALVSPAALAEAVGKIQRQPGDFRRVFAGKDLAVIAEIKFASPSEGRIATGISPVEVAGAYLQSGAAALSILTEEDFFQGHLDYLRAVRSAYPLALILQKDFMLDVYQIQEAFCAGADAVLIIVALVGAEGAAQLLTEARRLGLHALVEVHTEEELNIAKQIGADIIGINNRSLLDLKVSLDVTRQLMPLCPPQATVICESGLSTRAQLNEMAALGCDGFLIGASLMGSSDPGGALRHLLTAKGDPRCG